MIEAMVQPTPRRTTNVLTSLLRVYLTVALPILLVLSSVRQIMTPAFLNFEYTWPGFPEDFYGFTTEDRLKYAPLAIDYLLNGEDITFLSNLRFPDGSAMYNVRELQHMRDVKAVTQITFAIGVVAGFIALVSAYLLGRRVSTRRELRNGLLNGSILTLGMIAAIVLAAVINWDYFFTGFHTLFFEGGTWRFAYSDTLIRLFPEQFWFDAALLIGGMTTLGALIILTAMWRWKQ
jgi:integral membrane protein (TIGR01906 family)